MEETFAPRLIELLRQNKLTCATAESCTGGMIAAAITAVPGASQVFHGGAVTYTNACKVTLCGVKLDTITEFSAVSPQIARQMAAGIRQKLGADIGVSVTGNAGPTPSEDKPVGLVFIGLASDWEETVIQLPPLPSQSSRQEIRNLATNFAIEMMIEAIQRKPKATK